MNFKAKAKEYCKLVNCLGQHLLNFKCRVVVSMKEIEALAVEKKIITVYS